MEDYLEAAYQETFEAVYADMTHRKENDPAFTKQSLKELLDCLYVSAGNNWIGVGEAKENILLATIAACEAVLSSWSE
jgi:hypothetical protein